MAKKDFTLNEVKTLVWLAYMEGQRAGRIEQQTGKEKHFMSFWENFKDKVRPGYSIFEDFNPDGAK